MKLTSLEIKGFKSFADKTVINFNENITGVVGPNGSGKSNVVDAIRWVIGEQRTSNLRSEKMSNLIFNGSRNRKPSGMAEVSLSFENNRGLLSTEFTHVTITRILHRSGDSEYRLNDVPCRLKDISNLFLDTGISSDSYAIIEIKMIDEILNDRDNSRRRLFEQAAGVSKFKARKKETLAKLQGTDGDLARVEDLLFEIDNNLKQLENQAKKTKRFYKLREEYKELSVELAKYHVASFRKGFDELELKRKEDHNTKLEIEVRLRELEAELEKEKLAILEKEKHLNSRQKELNDLINNINKKESEKNGAIQQKSFLNDKIASLARQEGEASQVLGDLQKKQQDLTDRKIAQETAITTVTTELETLKQTQEYAKEAHEAARNILEGVASQRQELEKKIYQSEKDAAIQQSQKEQFYKSIEQNITDVKDRETSLGILKQDLEALQTQRNEQQQLLEQLIKEEEGIQKELAETIQILETTRQLAAKEQRSLDSKQNEYNLNKSLIENLEGFPDSIKFLKKQNHKLAQAPVLSDIIYCKEEYRVTVESYLEPFLNYLVAETLEPTQDAIGLLNQASKGRINCFLLSDFEHYQPDSPLMMANAIPATEVTETDPQYRKLAAFLLEHVYLVNESDIAELQQQNGVQSKAIFLSKNGKIIRTPHSISGGSVGLFEGMRIGRSKTLEKLKVEIEELQEKRRNTDRNLKQLEQNQQKLRQNTKQPAIQQARQNVNQADQKLASMQTKIENYQTFLDEFNKKNTSIKEKIDAIEALLQGHLQTAEQLKAEKATIDQHHAQLQEQFGNTSQTAADASARFNEQNIKFHQQQNLLAQITQEEQFTQNRLKEVTQRNLSNKEEYQIATQKIAGLDEVVKNADTELSELYNQRTSSSTGLTEFEAAFFKSREHIQSIEDRIRNWQKQQVEVLARLDQTKDKTNELKLELGGLKERLSVEFNMDINDLLDAQPDAERSLKDVQEEVARMRHRIETFGEINPMAVEAFDEMQQRHVFITAQRQDLISARESLMATMNEIEVSAKSKFMDAFSSVRNNFQMVFRSLFTEDDTCDLVLTKPEDPLESPIEIIARPKGKRPLVIDQLSGGEKTLTALAILFALYLLKPAPFCVLDEVDAPLDDTNIGKFNHAIRQFSKESQFIMVTHNKSTMAAVDVIYGVTMQEPGVSKVVPVDFRSLT
ncbi:chromosome segregation protein SMC [soil metagenome]